MTDAVPHTIAQTSPGIANAEKGFVILDGPAGVAVTLTPEAAVRTGESLIAAAAVALAQSPENPE